MNGVKQGEPVPKQVHTHQSKILFLRTAYFNAAYTWAESSKSLDPDFNCWKDMIFLAELLGKEYERDNQFNQAVSWFSHYSQLKRVYARILQDRKEGVAV